MNQCLVEVIKGRMICSLYPSRCHNEPFFDPISSTFLGCSSFSLHHYQVSGIYLAHISLSDLAPTSLSLIQWHVPFSVNLSFSLSCYLVVGYSFCIHPSVNPLATTSLSLTLWRVPVSAVFLSLFIITRCPVYLLHTSLLQSSSGHPTRRMPLYHIVPTRTSSTTLSFLSW